jgi:hypothetical protein
MKLNRCGCDIKHLVRVERTAWMRAMPGSGHYQCRKCGITMLLRRSRVDADRVEEAQMGLTCLPPSPSAAAR